MKPIGSIVRTAVRKSRNTSGSKATFSVQVNAGNRSRSHEEKALEAKMMKENGGRERQRETQGELSKPRLYLGRALVCPSF
jgi:hypothetical protein